jgi:hypothetical protein
MESLIDDLRNVDGLISDVAVFRSMLETTSTNVTPDNRNHGIGADVFKINCTFIFNF